VTSNAYGVAITAILGGSFVAVTLTVCVFASGAWKKIFRVKD
jgi:hypothetical protein